jgi:hypothetical protein
MHYVTSCMKSYGGGKPEGFPPVAAHGLRPQLRDSSYQFLHPVLAPTAPLVKTVMNIWMLPHD